MADLVLFSLSLICLAMTTVSLATAVWVVSSAFGSIGLWQICINNVCSSSPLSNGIIKGIQVLFIVAATNQFFSVCFALCGFNKQQRSQYRISVGLLAGSGLCTTIGMILAVTNATSLVSGQLTFRFGYSYYLGWVSCGLCFLSAMVFFYRSFKVSNAEVDPVVIVEPNTSNNVPMKKRRPYVSSVGGVIGGGGGGCGGGGC